MTAPRKVRITVTVDSDLVEAGKREVAAGSISSLSAWVNEALDVAAKRTRRLAALGEAIAAYEAEFGVITEEEMAEQERRDRETAIVVDGSASPPLEPGEQSPGPVEEHPELIT